MRSTCANKVGAKHYRLMPAKGIFALGVGHTRRKTMEPGAKSDDAAEMHAVREVKLSDLEWRVLMALKRELAPEEIAENLWEPRAKEADLPLPVFFEIAESLDERKVIGRFSTFLEHVKPTQTGERVTASTRCSTGPCRRARDRGGREIGRHHILTHCYWREGGPGIQPRQHHGRLRTARTAISSARTRRRSTSTSARWACRSPTPTSSGAAAARSSPRRLRRSPMPSGVARTGLIPRRCEGK
jgi:hypothetical protein